MGNFKRTVYTDPADNKDYQRWCYDDKSILYVGCMLNKKTVQHAIKDGEAFPGLRRDAAIGTRIMFYMLESAFSAVKDPLHVSDDEVPKGSIQVFFEDGSMTRTSLVSVFVENERTKKGFYCSFAKLLKNAAFVPKPISGNPYGRFDQTNLFGKKYIHLIGKDKKYIKEQAERIQNSLKRKRPDSYSTEVELLEPKDKRIKNANFKPILQTENFFVFTDKSNVPDNTADHSAASYDRLIKEFKDNQDFVAKRQSDVFRVVVTKEKASSWAGSDRYPQQITLMSGNSAGNIATVYGLKTTFSKQPIDYQWLHLIAHSMGPARGYHTPQNINNLILGTASANSLMMLYENQIGQAVMYYGKEATVDVTIKRLKFLGKDDYLKFIATKITYDYKILDDNGKVMEGACVEINPFQITKPSLISYKLHMALSERNYSSSVKSKKPVVKISSFISRFYPKKIDGDLGFDCKDLKPYKIVEGKFVPSSRKINKKSGFGLNAFYRPMAAMADQEDEVLIGGAKILGKDNVTSYVALVDDGSMSAHELGELVKLDNIFDFKGIACDGLEDYIFTDTKLTIDHKEKQATFTGGLNLDNEYLRPLLALMSDQKGDNKSIDISARIELEDEKAESLLEPRLVQLTSEANKVFVFGDFSLDKVALQLVLYKKFDYINLSSGWAVNTYLSGEFTLQNIADKPVTLTAMASYHGGTVRLSASGHDISGLFHIPELNVDFFEVEAEVGAHTQLAVSAAFTPALTTYTLAGVIAEDHVGILGEIEHLTMHDLQDIFLVHTGGEFEIFDEDLNNFTFEDITLSLATIDCSVNGIELRQGFNFKSKVHFEIADHQYNISADIIISKDKIRIEGGLTDTTIAIAGHDVRIESSKIVVELHREDKKTAMEVAVSCTAIIPDYDVKTTGTIVYRHNGSDWDCLLAAELEHGAAKLSSLYDLVSDTYIDSVSFSKFSFVYSTSDTLYEDGGISQEVKKGVQIIGRTNEIEYLSRLTNQPQNDLQFYALLNDHVEIGLSLKSGSDISLNNSMGFQTEELSVVIKPFDLDFSINFKASLTIASQEKPLHFISGIGLKMDSIYGQLVMVETAWENAFGINRLDISGVGGTIGFNIATGIPDKAGLSGHLSYFFDKKESTEEKHEKTQLLLKAVLAENPDDDFLLGDLEYLHIRDLLGLFESLSGVALSQDESLDFLYIEQLKIICAPQDGQYSGLPYRAGFSFNAKMLLFKKYIDIHASFNTDGIVIKGHVGKLSIGFLSVRGKEGKDLTVNIEMNASKQLIKVDAEIEISHILTVGVFVDIDSDHVRFEYEQKLFDVLDFTVKAVSEGSIHDPFAPEFNFSLSAILDITICEKIKSEAAASLTDFSKGFNATIDSIEEELEEKAKQYNNMLEGAMESVESECKKIMVIEQSIKGNKEKIIAARRQEIEHAENDYNYWRINVETDIAIANQQLSEAKTSLNQARQAGFNAFEENKAKAKHQLDDAQQVFNVAKRDAHRVFDAVKKVYDVAEQKVNSLDDQVHYYENRMAAPIKSPKDFFEKLGIPAILAGVRTAQGLAIVYLKVQEGILAVAQLVFDTALDVPKAELELAKVIYSDLLLGGAEAFFAVEVDLAQVGVTTAQAAITAVDEIIPKRDAAKKLFDGIKDTLPQLEYEFTLKLAEIDRSLLEGSETTLSNLQIGDLHHEIERLRHRKMLIQQESTEFFETLGKNMEDFAESYEISEISLSASLKEFKKSSLFTATIKGKWETTLFERTLKLNPGEVSSFVSALVDDFSKTFLGPIGTNNAN